MTAAEITEVLGMALSTVSRWLRRIGLGRRSALAPPEPTNRHERKRPGELIHVDVKKLGRIRGIGHRISGSRASQSRTRRKGRRTGAAGWEFVHVCVDDATRLAYVEVLPDEKGATAAGFLRRAVAWLSSMGVTVERVLSDNGSCYRSRLHAEACSELSMRHLRTRPYRPRTNGKPERFTAALPGWLDHYNYRRPHGSLGHRPPAARLAELEQPRG